MALAEEVEIVGGEPEQLQPIADAVRLLQAQAQGQCFDAVALVDHPLERERLLQRRNVLALQVLDDGGNGQLVVGHGDQVGLDRRQSGELDAPASDAHRRRS